MRSYYVLGTQYGIHSDEVLKMLYSIRAKFYINLRHTSGYDVSSITDVSSGIFKHFEYILE